MRISSSYFIMASLMPQIKCWGCFAWQYHFMLILDGTENEVVISLCHAATISLTIVSAAFYEDVAVTAGYGKHYTSKTFFEFLPKRVYRLMRSFLREGTLGEHAWLHTGAGQEDTERNNLQAWMKASTVCSKFDLSLWGKRSHLNELQAQVSHDTLVMLHHIISPE